MRKRAAPPGEVVADLDLPPAERVEGFLRMTNGQPISQASIAQRTGVTRRGLQKIIARLRRTSGLISSTTRCGKPASYEFARRDKGAPIVRPQCAHKCALFLDDHKARCVSPLDPPVVACPKKQLTNSHNSQDILPINDNENGVLKRAIRKELTHADLGNDLVLLILAEHYQRRGWVPAGDVGLRHVFRVAEHARRVGNNSPAMFVALIKKSGQQEPSFDPISLQDEDAADRRFKRAYYGERPADCGGDPLEDEHR